MRVCVFIMKYNLHKFEKFGQIIQINISNGPMFRQPAPQTKT